MVKKVESASVTRPNQPGTPSKARKVSNKDTFDLLVQTREEIAQLQASVAELKQAVADIRHTIKEQAQSIGELTRFITTTESRVTTIENRCGQNSKLLFGDSAFEDGLVPSVTKLLERSRLNTLYIVTIATVAATILSSLVTSVLPYIL